MADKKLKHNKKRNSFLIRECLVRKMAEATISNDPKMYTDALEILKEHFRPESPIGKEVRLAEELLESRAIDDALARSIMRAVRTEARKQDHRSLDIAKSRLIRDLHRTFGRNMLSTYRFEDYKDIATAQLLLNSFMRNDMDGVLQRPLLERVMCDRMTSHHGVQRAAATVDDPMVYSIAVKKFNEKYGSLAKEQRDFLREYMSITQKSDVIRVLAERRDSIASHLRMAADTDPDVRSDYMMFERLNEAVDELERLDVSFPGAADTLMMFCGLVGEIENVN